MTDRSVAGFRAMVDLDAVDDALMLRHGWARTKRGPIGEHCPPDGQRTARARAVAEMLAGFRPDLAEPDIAAMDAHRLCRECGYPLDRSAPYPALPDADGERGEGIRPGRAGAVRVIE